MSFGIPQDGTATRCYPLQRLTLMDEMLELGTIHFPLLTAIIFYTQHIMSRQLEESIYINMPGAGGVAGPGTIATDKRYTVKKDIK